MASDYGLNFGFRRSHEGLSVREGRQKTPKGAPIRQGAFVELNPTEPGRLRVCATGLPPLTGVRGLLVSEEFDKSIREPERWTSFDLGLAKPDRLAVVLSGAGTKFWLRNTAGQNRADGRVVSAVTMFTGTPVQGGVLTWNGTTYVAAAPGTANAVATITLTNGSDYVEAVLNA